MKRRILVVITVFAFVLAFVVTLGATAAAVVAAQADDAERLALLTPTFPYPLPRKILTLWNGKVILTGFPHSSPLMVMPSSAKPMQTVWS